MKTETQIAEDLQRKFKKWFKGCGERTSTGGTCGNLSRDEQLVFYGKNKTKMEKTKRFCEECHKGLFGTRGEILSHKASCQRFLEFLENLQEQESLICKVCKNRNDKIFNKIENDLKQAIKLYEDAGI